MVKRSFASIMVMAAILYGGMVSAGESNVVVEFDLNGKRYSVHGEETEVGQFVYNKGADEKIWITTLNRIPYVGQDICGQGWVQQFAVALFVSRGYEVRSTFYPWARTISIAEKGAADVLYPEWYIEDTAPSDVVKGSRRRDNLALSERFPGGPIALIKRKGEPCSFSGDLTMLKGAKIAVVRGYRNTPEFDALMTGVFSRRIRWTMI